MSRRTWRKRGLLAVLFALVASVAPAARAAATLEITALDAFGDKRPWDAGVTPAQYTKLYPSSSPYAGSQTGRGLAYVFGHVNGPIQGDMLRAYVDIAITDPSGATATRTVLANWVNDADAGKVQGDFFAELPVTHLGTHSAAAGPSTLTITATARLTDGSMSSAPRAADHALTKYAATPLDTNKPQVSVRAFPPSNWCHFSSEGAKDPFLGQHMGGTRRGDCGTYSPVPDATWVMCLKETSQLPDSTRQLFADLYRQTPFYGFFADAGSAGFYSNPFRGNYCRTNESRTVPSGEQAVDGTVFDDRVAPHLSSEIERIEVRVLQGGQVIRRYDSDAATRTVRTGPRASFGVVFKITDFEPNYPNGQPYVIEVQGWDAWGNASDVAKSSNITVYPW